MSVLAQVVQKIKKGSFVVIGEQKEDMSVKMCVVDLT